MEKLRTELMPEYIIFNGEFHKADEQLITVGNRAFKYGDGLFESMRYKAGNVMFSELHADRLQAGMKALKLDGGNLMDPWFLKKQAAALCKKNKLTNARLRLSVYREGEGFYMPEGNRSSYVLESAEAGNNYEFNPKGLIIDVYTDIPKPVNKLSNFKTSNALTYVMAGLFKKQHKLDEAIILNQNGFICEAISSNVFIVYQKQLYTPSLAEGCIGGVMRAVTLQLAKENKIPVTEAQLNPQLLNEAEEVFVTNASGGIRWVMGYGRKRYFNEVARFLSAKLNEK